MESAQDQKAYGQREERLDRRPKAVFRRQADGEILTASVDVADEPGKARKLTYVPEQGVGDHEGSYQ